MTPIYKDTGIKATKEEIDKGALINKLHALTDYATKDRLVAMSRAAELVDENPQFRRDPDVINVCGLIVAADVRAAARLE